MGKWLYKGIKTTIESILELFYEKENKCLVCTLNLNDNSYICNGCFKYLPHLENKILKYEGLDIKKIYSLFRFEDRIKNMVYDLKYNGERDISKVIGNIMGKYILENNIKADYLIPIPIHESKLSKRGYNHVDLIAKEISEITGIKLEKTLKKVINTSPQVLFKGEDRWYNIKGSFKCEKNYRNKKIIIIDDLVTTGATAHFASLEINLSKDNEISLMTFASSKKF